MLTLKASWETVAAANMCKESVEPPHDGCFELPAGLEDTVMMMASSLPPSRPFDPADPFPF